MRIARGAVSTLLSGAALGLAGSSAASAQVTSPLAASVAAAPTALQSAAAPAQRTAARTVSTRGWRTLRGSKGFRVRAPKGYRLRSARGAYEVSAPRSRVSLVGLRTTGDLASVAEGLFGVTPPDAAGGAERLAYRIALKGGKQGRVVLRRIPGGVAVVTAAPRGTRKTVPPTELARLAKVVETARGIRLTTLPTTTTQVREGEIPLKAFTTPDGTAKANVPDGPGWVASGRQGTVEGGHPELGGFAFGVAVPFQTPQGFCLPPCPLLRAPLMPAAAAIEQAWPIFLRSAQVPWNNIRVVSQVPGSAGVLGPGLDSGMFQFSAEAGGRQIVGYVTAGTAPVSADTWYLYTSYVATLAGVSGAVGDALMRTWASWDATVDQQRRQQLTFIARQETLAIVQQATEYRRRVFEKTNFNWVQLIRGQNPVLAPVDPNVIGDGGQTLVREPDGRLFDLQGNQFQVGNG